VLFAYASILEYLGFLVSTSLLLVVFSMILGGRLSRSVIVALVFSTASYLVFRQLLAIALPPGRIFFGGS
jgi:putative tricarboxylic transport membrane protein